MGDLAADGSQVRPYIVWFGEAVPMIELAFREVASADIFVVVGTSLQVYPAANLITASRAEMNYIIDPNTPRSISEMGSRLRVFATTATQGMAQLIEELMGEE